MLTATRLKRAVDDAKFHVPYRYADVSISQPPDVPARFAVKESLRVKDFERIALTAMLCVRSHEDPQRVKADQSEDEQEAGEFHRSIR